MSQDLFPGTPALETALSLPILCRGPSPQGLQERALGLRLCTELGSWVEAAFGPPAAILPSLLPRMHERMNSVPHSSIGTPLGGLSGEGKGPSTKTGAEGGCPSPIFLSHRDTEQRALSYLNFCLFSAVDQLTGSIVHLHEIKV